MDQMFSRMNRAALDRLSGRDPVDLAEKAGVIYVPDEQVFHFSSLGTALTVSYPGYEILPTLPGWHQLVILHYLDLADRTPMSGKEITFGQMKDGLIRGGGIDRKCETVIRELGKLGEAELSRRCEALGAEVWKTNADLSFRLPFLPRFPVLLKIWLPDEEFPASGRMLLDASADHYLTIEDAVTVAELLLEGIATP